MLFENSRNFFDKILMHAIFILYTGLHHVCKYTPEIRSKACRFAARLQGLASGLAPAVRPAGLAEAPGSTARRRRVPRSGMRSTVEAGGAGPDNARRSGAVAVTPFGDWHIWRMLTAWPRCRRAPQRDTAGTAPAGHRGAVRGSRRAVRLAAEGRGEKLPPQTVSLPSEPRPPTAGHLGRSIPLDCSRPSARFTAGAVRPGAPKVRP